MKKNRMKFLALLIGVTLLLTFTVSGTVAFLADNSGPVENVFKPTKVDTEITEEVENGTKSTVVITNAKDSIEVYVRVAVIGNWIKDNQIVEAWTPASDQFNTTDWIDADDGYCYYRYVVAPGGETDNLLRNGITSTTRDDGAHLEITVVHQSIQAKPKDAVSEAWNLDSAILNLLSDSTKP